MEQEAPAHTRDPSTHTYSLENFKSLVLYLQKNTDLFGISHEVPVPMNPTYMKQAVEKNKIRLPLLYQTSYAEPLLKNWDNVLEKLDGDTTTLETLSGVIYQRAPEDNKIKNPLNRFQITVTNIYNNFLSEEKRAHLNLPLTEIYAPLAMFQKDGRGGPFTIPEEDINQLFGGELAAVSIPGTYSRHPLLWVSLGHEVAGHDVLHADPGLLLELSSVIKKHITDKLGDLWSYWIDETASDVYGTLFYGPHFTLNLAFFFSAMNLQSGETQWMRTDSSAFGGQLDPHPTDVLRLAVGVGVIKNLVGLSEETKKKYVDRIEEIRDFIVGDKKTVKIDTIGEFPMDKMMEVAERVGGIIATAPLKCFNGKNIQDISTWNDLEESVAGDIAVKLDTDTTVAPFAHSSHVLAAATIAVLDAPDDYARVTTCLENLLDQLFAKNSTWNAGKQRKVMYHRKPLKNVEEPKPAAAGYFSWWSK
eukprot:TRINITY_DN537_c0_g1_i1.p1 TRINITY_DN537_c0_g1~~TRINITY_DN537_c0_g1_i1.p1  ORF type:complete len:475 (-),score=108.19 TRINITY_DN537_c0_g1_i1:42-1466(-)